MGHSQSRFAPSVQREAKNLVLPNTTNPPQRLRSTDNGCILQNGGTISGRKANLLPQPEFLQILQKKCQSLQEASSNLYGHRKSHSDPDIVRMMMNENDSEEEERDIKCENRRSIIAVSSSKAKIKSRKKKRAPEPPQSNTLPRTLGRVPVSYKNKENCYATSFDLSETYRRPLPPIPPPPPPDYNTTTEEALKSMSKNYEKNRRTVEKWKFSKINNECAENRKRCKSLDKAADQIQGEDVENKSGRCLRNISLRNSYLPSECTKSAFKDEIIKRGQEHRNQSFKLSMQNFHEPNTSRNDDSFLHEENQRTSSGFRLSYDNIKKHTTDYNKRNLVTKQASCLPIDSNKWNSVSKFLSEAQVSSSATSEEEMEIDLQLRPTLPRRPVEISRFSPTDVWKSINLDFFKSHQQRSDISSDDADEILEEKICRINRPVAPRRLIHDGDSGISPDAGSPMLLNKSIIHNNSRMGNGYPIEEYNSMWVPQHDLADDSECESEDALLDNSSKTNSQAKFSMPNLMFPSRSLPRTDQKKYIDEAVVLDKEKLRSKGRQKKCYKNSEGQHFNSLRNLKKALGLRSKVAGIENKGLDSNWSLSRSLPNFINSMAVKNNSYVEKETSEICLPEHIRRSNSELKADPNEIVNYKLENCNQILNSEWRKSFPGQSSEGHVIYLPEYRSNTAKIKNYQTVEDIQVNTDSEIVLRKFNNRKKFSYQSTVRQEEKKKLEEKLAREVEARERKRQKEIEWMNKVEEEFRKQRDKEKVNIRHQLRIFNLKENSPSDNQVLGKNDSPSPATRDEDIAWQQPTGMKKWLKRQNRDRPTRPEPEGSSDEQKDVHNSKCKCIDGNEFDCCICDIDLKRKSYDTSKNRSAERAKSKKGQEHLSNEKNVKNCSVLEANEETNTFESHFYHANDRKVFTRRSNFQNEIRKKTIELENRARKYQFGDYESDDSGSDVCFQRPRSQKRKEPSFTRNHPHRYGGRGKPQIARPACFVKNSNSAILSQ